MPRIVAAATSADTRISDGETQVPPQQYPEIGSPLYHLPHQTTKQVPTGGRPVPSVEIDCAARHFALEFAIQKLPWSSPSQRQDISDALRLEECPLPFSSKEGQQEKESIHERENVSLNEPSVEKSSATKILRGRRAMKYTETTEETNSSQKKAGNSNDDGDERTTYIFVDPSRGSDGALGTRFRPLETIPAALDLSRKVRSSLSNKDSKKISIVLRGGRYHLKEPLRLDSRDSRLILKAHDGETPVLSGGDTLSLTMSKTSENPSVYSAKLPKGDSFYNFTMLFLDRSKFEEEEENVRLVWAREPNGHPERDLQPDGYATANGTDSRRWPDQEGSIHFVLGKNGYAARNSTYYPWHGEDKDPRGNFGAPKGLQMDAVTNYDGRNSSHYAWHGEDLNRHSGECWLHFGGLGNRFVDGKGYWNGSVSMGLKFHGTELNTSGWTTAGYTPAIAHVFHNGYWGNWQFEIDSVTTNENVNGDEGGEGKPRDGRLSFKRGGWQEGRGGGIGHQPFFVEGVKEALDMPGEWWLDVPKQVLYYYPFGNETNTEFSEETLAIDFVAPRLQRLIEVVGENSGDRTANGITIHGLTFVHTATTFMEPYEVPSPGDWSIHRGGALFIENARDTTIQDCEFLRTGGNAVMVSGHAKRSLITMNEFGWIGDSAIVTLGRVPMADGFTVDTYPEDTVIKSNHFHEIGIHGKQTSALFSALSCKTRFVENVLYNGPRAGINLNDSFCHGHTISGNLLFNWVRETQDHGPINTWDRAMYIQKDDLSKNPTLIPQWTHIERNFIMNGPSGNRDLGNLFPTIDNDDGSSYFYIAKNLLVYGGGKNFLGNDKSWVSNLFVFPGRWSREPCAQIWGGKNNHFEGNTCLIAPGDPPIGLDGNMNAKNFRCKIDWNDPENNLEFVGKTANNSYYLDKNDKWGFGCGNGTSPNHLFMIEEMQKHGWELGSSIRDSKLLSADGIIDLAKNLLKIMN